MLTIVNECDRPCRPGRAPGESVPREMGRRLNTAAAGVGIALRGDCLYIGSELAQGSRIVPRRRDEWTAPQIPISVEINGVTHHGHYEVEKGMLRVEYKLANKVTQLGGSVSAPATLARVILRELVREASQ